MMTGMYSEPITLDDNPVSKDDDAFDVKMTTKCKSLTRNTMQGEMLWVMGKIMKELRYHIIHRKETIS